jgi:Ca-activated chloride channel homolog
MLRCALFIAWAALLCIPASLRAQTGAVPAAKGSNSPPQTTRILFLLDGSGSMLETWQGRNRFEVARELLVRAVDSIERVNPRVEFALRVFGHQQPRDQNDCEDTRLELPFGKGNAGSLRQALDRIKPQGHTPIAYSLFLAAHDFPPDPQAVNAIILITDGLENCGGDPCAAAEALSQRRVALRPYIIGMGLQPGEGLSFDCVGSYYDAADPQVFQDVLGVVVSQALRNTTVQVNLLDHLGRATETEVELTFYDAYTGKDLYHFVHTTLRSGAPDTLYLDPAGRYNLTAHTTPPATRRNLELVAGRHNILAVDVPQGELALQVDGSPGFSELKCLVRDPLTRQIVYVQHFNTNHRYLAGTYHLEILSRPRVELLDFPILPGQLNKVNLPAPGKLLVQAAEPGILGVFTRKSQELVLVHEWPAFSGREVLDLQPGEYVLVYRVRRKAKTEYTRELDVVIYPAKTVSVRLDAPN